MVVLPVSKVRAPWPLLIIVLLGGTAAAVSAGATAPATNTGDLGGDGAITYEAADLSEAHAPGLEEEMRSMESLLHWAICKSLRQLSGGNEGRAAVGYHVIARRKHMLACPQPVSSTLQCARGSWAIPHVMLSLPTPLLLDG